MAKYPNDIVILGMGASRRECPFDDRSVPVFSCNTGYMQIAEMKGWVTKIFMAHKNHIQKSGRLAYDFGQMNYLVEQAGIEIYNINRCEGLKHKMYPLKTIIKKFETDYFSDTICYMIAYALHVWTVKKNGRVVLKNPEERYRLRFYGVDMATYEQDGIMGEYTLEKGGVEFWIGIAKGLGVKIEIAEGSFVCKTITRHPYGIEYFDINEIWPEQAEHYSKYLIHG